MADIKQINSLEAKQKIIASIYKVFGNDFPEEYAEEWYQMLISEIESTYYEDYTINVYSNILYFSQYGEKEYFHDGSSQLHKFIRITPISEEEYNTAKTHQCVIDSAYHEYKNGWINRGTERFFVVWVGRYSDYIYYAKNIAGVSFVKITIESGY